MIFEISYASDRHIGEKMPCGYAFKIDDRKSWMVEIKTIEDFAKLSKDVVKNAKKSRVGHYENNNGEHFNYDETDDTWMDECVDTYYPAGNGVYENCDGVKLLIADLRFVYTERCLPIRIDYGSTPSLEIIDDYIE